MKIIVLVAIIVGALYYFRQRGARP